jgi:hypothetical protein
MAKRRRAAARLSIRRLPTDAHGRSPTATVTALRSACKRPGHPAKVGLSSPGNERSEGRATPDLTANPPAVGVAPATLGRASLGERTFYFMTAVVAIQGGHVVEHIVQLVQVSLLGVPEQDALGLLGYVLQFNGTEEWLHLGYNTFYLLALYALIVPLWRITPAVLPLSAFVFFIAASVWLETWHMVEHGVIISNVIANGGCPCPGIGDTALGLSDTVLHFVYNAIAYAGVAYAYILVVRDRRRGFPPHE